MKNFIFQNPTKILFGEGQIALINQEIPENAKVLMTYGGGSIKKNGVYDQVKTALKNHQVIEFSGIEPNPAYETLIQAVELARAEKVDFLLAVGGGSVVDGTKFIAAAIPFEGNPWDILEKQADLKSTVPLGCVLTLPATGTEMNGGAVITKKATQDKLAFITPLNFPVFSVLDPTTTYSLPAKQVSNGIVDGFTHVMEQYLTYPVNARLQDRFAESILKTLVEVGPTTLKNPTDYDSRADFMWCTTMALNGLLRSGVPEDWATHMIGHELTALHGLDHAQTLAIVLPAIMEYKTPQKEEKLLQYAERIWQITSGSKEERINKAIQKTRDFFESLSVGTRLSSYNLSSEIIPNVIASLKKHNMTTLGEHQDITPEDAIKILELSA